VQKLSETSQYQNTREIVHDAIQRKQAPLDSRHMGMALFYTRGLSAARRKHEIPDISRIAFMIDSGLQLGDLGYEGPSAGRNIYLIHTVCIVIYYTPVSLGMAVCRTRTLSVQNSVSLCCAIEEPYGRRHRSFVCRAFSIRPGGAGSEVVARRK
jgi:hypothetical protein